jgi:phage internal scaffolding protein
MEAKIRSIYGVRERKPFTCIGESRTHQSFKDECDINRIVESGRKGKQILHINSAMGDYIDTISIGDYQSSLNLVISANERFESLPATIRDRFANSPAEFIKFVGNPSNVDEMVKLGLATKRDLNVNKKPTSDLPDESKSK